MKKFLFLFIMAVYSQLSGQLSPTENYIQSIACLNEDCTRKSEAVTYYDGLGRPKQIVNVKVTPTGKDLVIPITYDGFGRRTKEILPTPINTLNSAIHSGVTNESAANSFYGVSNAYAEKEFENSPLDRVLQQAHAGDSWKINSGHTQKMKYEANNANEVLKFVTNTQWVNGATSSAISLATDTNSENGNYKAAQLYKTTITDEDGNPVIQFKNGRGQILLIRNTDGTQDIDTYYVYNEYNQKAFVIPPKAVKLIKNNGNIVTQDILDDLCYQYRYDGQDREVEKKLPGKGWQYIVYDKQDRPVLAQDAVLRTVNNNFNTRGWLFTKYDEFGRVVYTGFFANTATRQAMQSALNNMSANAGNNERRSRAPFNSQGIDIYYDKQGFPTGSMTVLTLNYYDTYPVEAPAIPTTVLGQYTLPQTLDANNHASTNSLQVASYVKNIDDNNWTKTYTYYDSRARPVALKTVNHLGGYTNKEFKLDFTGLVEESYTYHKKTPNDTEVKVKERFVYDNQNRILKQYHQVDNLQEELLAENTYNEIGQQINKKTGNTTGTPLQSIDYTYNIRGWLTSINNPNNPASFNNKLFGFELKYDNPASPAFATAKYNGSISEFDWKTANGNTLRRYGYKYDKLDRLTDASYLEPLATVPVTNGYGEFLTYDENGNIQTLKRYQSYNNTAMLIDDLVYSNYKGNQLINVTDNSSNNLGYPIGGNTIAYDLNGNMINHVDKGITNISYNYLNLPKDVLFSQNNSNIKLYYRADGVKLKKAFTYLNPRSGFILTEDTDYLDGFQYFGQGSSNSLQFFPTSEGYYDYEKKRYVYNYSDIWGNVRLAYYNSNNTATIDREMNYYPFGLEYQGYNGTNTQTPNYTYGFQGQERQKETGWGSFKWRNNIPELGRFFNIDPLAEKYTYNSPFAFQENKIGLGRELEGLEMTSFDMDSKDPNVKYMTELDGVTNYRDSKNYQLFNETRNSILEPAITTVYSILPEIAIEEVVVTGLAKIGFFGRVWNALKGVFKAESEVSTIAETTIGKVPNPYGKTGGPAHKAAVKEAEEQLVKDGFTEIDHEVMVKTPNGNKSKRFIDVQGTNPTTKEIKQIQVGKQTQKGKPISRERKALDDIEKATGVRPEFKPYNTVTPRVGDAGKIAP
ncbi:RHS repeat-associated core domain-containing protein [Chryseobacterium indologenes]|uniref:DUF6443 domain-containing protein n=1 Tax=Chryseobacterium indologenes TaxID=253 RepID=UPI001108C827|nr:DUF6443 domain-containing protein [Chryseobacterium indologenes]TLX25400.1 RHS repeat-associated core domain-containing protein [Chryseobacterium indologenes]